MSVLSARLRTRLISDKYQPAAPLTPMARSAEQTAGASMCGRGERGGAHARGVRFKGVGDGAQGEGYAWACVPRWLALRFLTRARLAPCGRGDGPDRWGPPIGQCAESRLWVAGGGGSGRA
jgi:hypothetical protein